jgi:type IV pilus assembly protein PilO
MQISGVEVESLQFENIGSWPFGLRATILIIIFVTTIVFGFFFDLTDIAENLASITIQRLKLESDFAQTHHIVINLDAYRQQVETVGKTLALLTQQIPTNNEEAQLLEEISQQASSAGLQFRSIKPLTEARKAFYVEQPLELSLQGSYHSFGEFISSLSSLPRIVTIHNFSIAQGPAGPSKLDITVTVKTYWAAEKLEKRK